MRLMLTIVAVLVVLACGLAFGISRHLTSYAIQRMWSDATSVYVVYNLRRESVQVSLSDIDGTVKGQKDELRLLRRSKVGFVRSDKLNLVEGDTATSSIYQDADFNLTRTKEGATLRVGSTRTDLPLCDIVWAATGAVRSAPGLFYCGAIYDTNGKVIFRLPANIGIEDADRSHIAQKVEPLNSAANRFAVAFGKESLMVVPLSQVKSSDGLTTKSWPMNGGHESSLVLPLAASDDAYLPQSDALAYSPERIVLRPIRVEDKWILLCTQKNCQQVPIPWEYSYVIVDEIDHECIFFRQQDLTKPVVDIRTISF